MSILDVKKNDNVVLNNHHTYALGLVDIVDFRKPIQKTIGQMGVLIANNRSKTSKVNTLKQCF